MTRFRQVAVWPRGLRISHWINAFSVLLLIPLGAFLFFGDRLGLSERAFGSVVSVHASVGMVLTLGVVARVVFLFAGPPAARWNDVLPHTREQFSLLFATLRYYISGFKGKAPLYLTHNPVAGALDTVLFVVFLSQATSGLSMFFFHSAEHDHSHNHNHAALEGAAAGWPPEWFEVLHVAGAVFIVVFVLAHFTALAWHDIFERRGLVSSMISGRKFFSEKEIEELGTSLERKGLKAEDE